MYISYVFPTGIFTDKLNSPVSYPHATTTCVMVCGSIAAKLIDRQGTKDPGGTRHRLGISVLWHRRLVPKSHQLYKS